MQSPYLQGRRAPVAFGTAWLSAPNLLQVRATVSEPDASLYSGAVIDVLCGVMQEGAMAPCMVCILLMLWYGMQGSSPLLAFDSCRIAQTCCSMRSRNACLTATKCMQTCGRDCARLCCRNPADLLLQGR